MKILYLSYDGMTDQLGQSQVIPYLTKLSEKKIEITIISFEKHQNFIKNKNSIQNILYKNNINWIPLKYHKSPPILSTLYDLYILNKKVTKLFKNDDYNIIHCRSYITSIVGLRLKRKYGAKFIFDMRGFWADERFDGNIWNKNKLIYRIIYKYVKKLEKSFIISADYIVSLTEQGKQEIISWNYKRNLKIEVIPCCADLNLFCYKSLDNLRLSKFKTELNISENDFIISYLGSIGTWYMLNEMLEFFKVLLQTKPDSIFLFITNEIPEIIIDNATKLDIPKSKLIITNAQRNDVPYMIALSKISVFFIKPLYSKKASSPTKQGEILGMGIPIICNANVGDNDSIISQNKVGCVVKSFSDNEYYRAIENIDNLISIPKNIINSTSQKYFSLDIGAEKYYKIYFEILNNNNNT